MEQILALDATVFLAVNRLWHPAFFVSVAQFFSLIGSYGLVWLVVSVLLFFREEKRHHSFFFPIGLSFFGSLLFSEWIGKYFVGRPRPFLTLPSAVFVSELTSPSYPSTHTTVAFALAVVLSRYERRLSWVFFSLAWGIGLSRIYLGVHYPLDVISGALLGSLIGHTALVMLSLKTRKIIRQKAQSGTRRMR